MQREKLVPIFCCWGVTIQGQQPLVAQFLTASTTNAWRQQLLKQYGVYYGYYGLQERAAGNFRLETATFLEAVYDNELVQIYQVIDLE